MPTSTTLATESIESHKVVYWQAEDILIAEVSTIQGCFSDGRTIEEARERVRDAILNFLEDYFVYNAS